MDDGGTVVLNTVLFFLVVLEPYLGTIVNTRSGATAFAIDVGTTLLILGAFYQFAIIRGRGVGAKVKQLEWRRKITIVSALVFNASIIPGLIPELQNLGVQGMIWLLTLIIAVASRSRKVE